MTYRLELNNLIVWYWVVALFCVVLRMCSVWFGGLCSYSKSQLLYGKFHGRKDQLAAYNISRQVAFKAFYFIGIFSTIFFIGFSNQLQLPAGSGMTYYIQVSSVPLILPCYLFHVSRRLHECEFVHKFSNSSLSLFAFLAGASFYILVPLTYSTCPSVTLVDLTIESTRHRVCAQLILLLLASFWQRAFHADLASLRRHTTHENESPKYSPPPFRTVLFPHYAMEIALYILFSLFASSAGAFLIFSLPALLTICNLCVTASEQREYYVLTSQRSIKLPQYNVLPWVF